MFEVDPLITEDKGDEVGENQEQAEKLERFMEQRKEEEYEPNLLKSIGKSPAAKKGRNEQNPLSNSIATMPTGIGNRK